MHTGLFVRGGIVRTKKKKLFFLIGIYTIKGICCVLLETRML